MMTSLPWRRSTSTGVSVRRLSSSSTKAALFAPMAVEGTIATSVSSGSVTLTVTKSPGLNPAGAFSAAKTKRPVEPSPAAALARLMRPCASSRSRVSRATALPMPSRSATAAVVKGPCVRA